MKKLTFDNGLQEVRIGGGVLRFNPQDPNLFVRFEQAGEKLRAVEADMVSKARSVGEDSNQVARILHDGDRQMKQILDWVFGAGNDFDAILQGVNLLAVAGNGERVVTNLFAALEPVLVEGAKGCAQARAAAAAAKAQNRRAVQ